MNQIPAKATKEETIKILVAIPQIAESQIANLIAEFANSKTSQKLATIRKDGSQRVFNLLKKTSYAISLGGYCANTIYFYIKEFQLIKTVWNSQEKCRSILKITMNITAPIFMKLSKEEKVQLKKKFIQTLKNLLITYAIGIPLIFSNIFLARTLERLPRPSIRDLGYFAEEAWLRTKTKSQSFIEWLRKH